MYSQGRYCKKGDKLVFFDMTLVQMELKIAKLETGTAGAESCQSPEATDKSSEWRSC